jgi:thiol-disulfide isomerase/thioredoxin
MLQVIVKNRPPATLKALADITEWLEDHDRRMAEAAKCFYFEHKTDARAVEAARLAIQSASRLLATVNHMTVQRRLDMCRRLDMDQLVIDVLSRADLSTSDRRAIMYHNAENLLSIAALSGLKTDRDHVKASLDALADQFPNAANRENVEYRFGVHLLKTDPVAAGARIESLQTDPNPAVVHMGKKLMLQLTSSRTPLEMKFTAIDGRAVDLAKLRGKVVLIDFWGSWCGPCVAELPHIKDVYQKYHSQGFEVVGLARDNSVEPAQKVISMLGIPWPQYWDAPGSLASDRKSYVEQFGISSFPTLWLLNKDGLVVNRDARAEQLESLVRRELRLTSGSP